MEGKTTREAGQRFALVGLLAVFVLLIGGGAARAEPGNLDPTFGVGGLVTAPVGSGSFAEALALQPDGKIVVAGTGWGAGITVARYTVDGWLDPTFGTNGTTTVGGDNVQAWAVALQPDGKIIVAGRTLAFLYTRLALTRFNPDGSLDHSFGSGGMVTTQIGQQSSAWAVAVQPDGRIVAGGGSWDGTTEGFGLARYEADGSLDPSFGSGGTVTTLENGLGDVGALALQPDGKIVAVGDNFSLARYEPNGSLDATFGSHGVVRTENGYAYAAALQPDGKVVVAGGFGPFVLARFDADGSPDTTFGSGGAVQTQFAPGFGGARGVAIQPDGKIVAAGGAQDGVIDTFALARYNPDGSLDPAFGSGGKVLTGFSAGYHFVWADSSGLALQPDGKIVVAGWAQTLTGGGVPTFALARYLVSPGCRVPDVRRMRLAVAETTLSAARCAVGTVTRTWSRKVGKGRVVSQRPAPGTGLIAGAKINLVISKGRRKLR